MNEFSVNQNIVAAKVFLNAFGYNLDDNFDLLSYCLKYNGLGDSYFKDGKVSINVKGDDISFRVYDKNDNDVGEVYIKNGKIIIDVKHDDTILKASYKIPKVTYGCWNNQIHFHLKNNGNETQGDYKLECLASVETGILCNCSVELTCKTKDNVENKIEIFNNGTFFRTVINNQDKHEDITVNIWDDWDPHYYAHIVTKGEMDENGNYPYQVNSVIGNELGKDGKTGNIIFFMSKKEYDKEIAQYNVQIPRNKEDSNYQELIRIADNMRCFDPKIFDNIYMLQEPMMIGNTSVLQNLLSTCLDNYPNDVIYALLGIRKNNKFYQDNASTLVEAYFGTEEKSDFPKLLKQFKK